MDEYIVINIIILFEYGYDAVGIDRLNRMLDFLLEGRLLAERLVCISKPTTLLSN